MPSPSSTYRTLFHCALAFGFAFLSVYLLFGGVVPGLGQASVTGLSEARAANLLAVDVNPLDSPVGPDSSHPTMVAATGTVRYVAATGTDTGNCTNAATPCRTIAYALGQATAGDTISLAAGTYQGSTVVNKDVTIRGAGRSSTLLTNTSLSSPVLKVEPGIAASVEDLAIGNITGAGYWPCVYTRGPLTVSNVNIQNCISTTDPNAAHGLVVWESVLTMTNSTVSGHGTSGIRVYGDARIISSTMSGNTYVGLEHGNGALTMTNSTVSGNRGSLGGILLFGYSDARIISTTVSGNTSHGVYQNAGGLTMTNSTVSGNGGTGIRVDSGARATLINSTAVSGNTGTGISIANSLAMSVTISGSSIISNTGGGIYNGGNLTVTASSIVSNTSAGPGGGIRNDWTRENVGQLAVTNSTIARNTTDYFDGGGGIYHGEYGSISIDSSTIANNRAPGGGGNIRAKNRVDLRNSIIVNGSPDDCYVPFAFHRGDLDYNIDGDGSCLFTAPHSATDDPMLGPLTGNPPYFPLRSDSSAIDVIPPGVNGCGTIVAADQRGFPRPGGPACDIGAYEIALLSASVTPTSSVPYRSVVTYTATVYNLTAITDTTASLFDPLPPEIRFGGWITGPVGAELVDYGDETYDVNWRGVLPPNSSVTLAFTATHIGNFGDVVTNTFEYRGRQSSSYSISTSFTVEPAAVLTVVQAGHPEGGIITSDPAGLIACGVTCTVSVRPGTPITLTASTYVTGTFYGWSANACGGVGTGPNCTLPMTTSTTVTTTYKVKTAIAVTAVSPTLALVGQAVMPYYDANAPGTLVPSGNVTVTLSDGVSSCRALVTTGKCLMRPSTAGTFDMNATYPGDPLFEGSVYTTTYTVNPAATSLSLEAFPPTTVVGQGVDIDYLLGVVPPGGGLFTGTVRITDSLGNVFNVAAPTDSITRTITVTPTVAGSLVITATFSGNANYLASSAVITHEVSKVDTAIRITGDTPDYSRLGQGVVVSFTVAAQSPGSGTPTGQVRIGIRNDTASCTATVAQGSCVITPTRRLNTILVASYRGDDNFNASSTAEPHMVGNPNAPMTRITIDADLPNPSVVGQSVVISYTSAVLTPTNTVLPGEVVVIDSDGNYCVGPVTGSCSLTLRSTGPMTLTALYSGNDDYQGAIITRTHTVNPANTITRYRSAAPEPSVLGNPVLIYYTVDARDPGSGTPLGTVNVRDSDGNACSGSAPIGRCRLTPLSPGYKTVTAVYSATMKFNSSQGSGTHEVTDIPIQDLMVEGVSPAMITYPAYFTATVSAGTNIVYRWDFGDATLPITSTVPYISHTFTMVDLFTVTVSASNWGSSAEAQTTIRTVDVPITGLQAFHSGAALLGNTVSYTATVSTGTNVVYMWDFGDGSPRAYGRTVRHIYARTGNFTPRVYASNGANRSEVNGPVVPVVTIISGLSAGDNSPVNWGQTMLFTSTVESGLQARYQWNWGNGAPVYETTRRTARYRYPAGGDYTVVVTATNDASFQVLSMPVSVADDRIVGLSAVSSAPTHADETTYFSASVEQGTSVVYTWEFGDGSPPVTGANVQHKYDPPPGTRDTVVYTARVTARNSRGSAEDTTEVSVYFAPPETREAGSVRITGGRFREMGDGTTRVLDMIAFADGKLRLTGPGAVVYYSRSTIVFTGTLELRSNNRSFKIGTGQFTAPVRGGQASAVGPLSGQFSELSGFRVSGASFTVDLVNALMKGTATQMNVDAPSQRLTLAVNRFTVSVQGSGIQTTGTLGEVDVTVAGTPIRIDNFNLQNVGVTAPTVRVSLPAAVGGRQVTLRNFHLGPNEARSENSTVTLSGAAGTVGPANVSLERTSAGLILTVDGTLRLALPQNRQTLEIDGVIGADGRLSARFDTITLGVSGSQLTLVNGRLESLNSIQATQSILQMQETLGGVSQRYGAADVTPTEIRLDGTRDIVFPDFYLAEGTQRVSAPTGRFQVSGKGWEMVADGSYEPTVRLSRSASIHLETGPSGRLKGQVTGLAIDMNVLDIEPETAEVKSNGVVFAKTAEVTLARFGWAGSSTIHNVSIGASGLKIGGGAEFELPDIRLGAFWLTSLGGKFLQRDADNYVIGFQGGFQVGPLPGQKGYKGKKPTGGGPSCNGIWIGGILALDYSNRPMITLMPVREAPVGIQSMNGVSVESAQVKVYCSIPIPETGFEISELRGQVTMDDRTSRISLGLTIESEVKLGHIPAVAVESDAYLQWSPYWEIGMDGGIEVFSYRMARSSSRLGTRKAQLSMYFDIIVVDGEMSAVVWRDDGGTSMAAWAIVRVRVMKGFVYDSWLLSIPPSDITVGRVSIEAGRFQPRNAWGVKGQVSVAGLFDVGAYVDHKGKMAVTDLDEYQLSRPSAPQSLYAANNGLPLLPSDDIREATFGAADDAIFALAGVGTLPTLTIQDPQGNAITGSPRPSNVKFSESTRYELSDPPPAPDGQVRARFVHAAPAAGAVDVTLGDTVLSSQALGTIADYQSVSTTLQVRVAPAGGGAPLLTRTLNLSSTIDATIALVPSGSAVDLVVFSDTNWPLPGNESQVRLVNLAPSTSALNLNHPTGLMLAGPVTYTLASRYAEVDPGTSGFKVRDDETLAVTGVVTTTATEAGHIYTIFVLPPPSGQVTPRVVLQRDTPSQARLRLANFGPSQGALDLRVTRQVDGSPVETVLASNVAYTQTSSYASVDSVALSYRLTPAGVSGTTVASGTLALEHGVDYTVVAAPNGTAVHPLLLTDDNSIPAEGMTRLRLVNLAGPSNPVSLQADQKVVFDNVGSNASSAYRVISGTVSLLEFFDFASVGQLALPASLQDGRSYTVFAYAANEQGDLGATVVTDLATQKVRQQIYVVHLPQPGRWRSTMSGGTGPQDRYDFVVLGTTASPTVSDLAVSQTPGTRQAQISWKLATPQPDTVIGIYANSDPITATTTVTATSGVTSTEVVTRYFGTSLAYNLTLADVGWVNDTALMTRTLDLSELPSGTYRIWLDVQDSRNVPTRQYAPQTVTVSPQPWSTTWSGAVITPTASYRQIDLAWLPHSDPDVASYAVRISGPTITGTSVYTVGLATNTGFGSLDPNAAYTLTVGAVRSDGQVAWSAPLVATALGAPLGLAINGPSTFDLDNGESAVPTLALSTTFVPYPEQVALVVGDLPPGLDVDLPLDPVSLPGAGLAVTVPLTVTEYVEPGRYVVPITAFGPGYTRVVSLTVSVGQSQLAGVVLSGLATLQVNTSQVFTATASTLSANSTVTYTWQATGQSPITRVGGSLDLVTFEWLEPGSKLITVTASNDAGSVVSTWNVTVVAGSPTPRILQVIVDGNASVRVDPVGATCTSACAWMLEDGTTITLTADWGIHSGQVTWGGDLSATGNAVSFALTSDTSVNVVSQQARWAVILFPVHMDIPRDSLSIFQGAPWDNLPTVPSASGLMDGLGAWINERRDGIKYLLGNVLGGGGADRR